MTQAVVLFPLPQFEYKAYAVGDVVDFGPDDLTYLKQRWLIDDTPAVVAAAIAGGKVPKTHTEGQAPSLVPVLVDEATSRFTTEAAREAARAAADLGVSPVGASRSLTVADDGRVLDVTAAGVTLTVPAGLVPMPQVIVLKHASGTSIAFSGGATGNGASSTLAITGQMAAVVPTTSSDAYRVSGV